MLRLLQTFIMLPKFVYIIIKSLSLYNFIYSELIKYKCTIKDQQQIIKTKPFVHPLLLFPLSGY